MKIEAKCCDYKTVTKQKLLQKFVNNSGLSFVIFSPPPQRRRVYIRTLNFVTVRACVVRNAHISRNIIFSKLKFGTCIRGGV